MKYLGFILGYFIIISSILSIIASGIDRIEGLTFNPFSVFALIIAIVFLADTLRKVN